MMIWTTELTWKIKMTSKADPKWERQLEILEEEEEVMERFLLRNTVSNWIGKKVDSSFLKENEKLWNIKS